MRDHDYWVYILTNKYRTTLYIGITNDIMRRLSQHRRGEVESFTKHYPRLLALSDVWEHQPRVYARPWDTDEMIRDSSLRSE